MIGNSRRQSGLGGGWKEQDMGTGGARLTRALEYTVETFYFKLSRSLLENDVILHLEVGVVAVVCAGLKTAREAGAQEGDQGGANTASGSERMEARLQ